MKARVEQRHRIVAFRCFPEFDEIPWEKVKWVREGVFDIPNDNLREDLARVAQAIADAEATPPRPRFGAEHQPYDVGRRRSKFYDRMP